MSMKNCKNCGNNIRQKDEMEIDDSNLKDFLEQDLEGIEFILKESEEFTLDLMPVPISKLVKKSKIKLKKSD